MLSWTDITLLKYISIKIHVFVMKFFKQQMAWNEPNDSDKKESSHNSSDKKDPWSGGRNDDGPPDLDEIFNKIKSMFMGGGKNSGASNDGSNSSSGNPFSNVGLSVIAVVLVIIWGLSGFYIIDEGNRGIVLRFGAYLKTAQPGPNWRPNFIDTVITVELDRNRSTPIGYRTGAGGRGENSVNREALMITKDENIVDVKMAVQYRISDAEKYVFNNRSPEMALKEATESALREVIGKSTMDYVLTEGRAEVAVSVKTLTQKILDRYDTGLILTSINMKSAQPPDQVQDAFHDAVKAREDQVRLKNEAEAYSNDIIPRARGNAARQIAEAQAYREQVVSKAEGEASRFLQVYKEYKAAPEVTRERIYIDAMETVMTTSNKVMIDVKAGNNLLYLPLDKIGANGSSNNTESNVAPRIQVLPVVPDSMRNRVNNTINRATRDARSRSRER